MRFDFAVFDSNGNLSFLLELDGIQHYKLCNYAKTQDILDKNKSHDKMKDDYCKNNNIKLFRIPYWKFNDINNEIEKILKQVNLVPSSE